MIPLTPGLLERIAAIRENPRAAEVLVDLWTHPDYGEPPTIADVLELYLLPPPPLGPKSSEITCAACHGVCSVIYGHFPVLCLHCAGKGTVIIANLYDPPAEDTSLQPLLVEWCRRHEDARWEAVGWLDCWEFSSHLGSGWAMGDSRDAGMTATPKVFPTEAAAKLASKLRVAGMFPECKYKHKELSVWWPIGAEELLLCAITVSLIVARANYVTGDEQ